MTKIQSLQELLDVIQQHQLLNEAVCRVACAMAAARKSTYYPPEQSYNGFEVEFDANGNPTIIANFAEYYRGNTDYDSIEIPLYYFWTEDVMAVETETRAAVCAERERQAKLKEQRDEEEQRRKDEERERQNYERLKKKFEGEPK